MHVFEAVDRPPSSVVMSTSLHIDIYARCLLALSEHDLLCILVGLRSSCKPRLMMPLYWNSCTLHVGMLWRLQYRIHILNMDQWVIIFMSLYCMIFVFSYNFMNLINALSCTSMHVTKHFVKWSCSILYIFWLFKF